MPYQRPLSIWGTVMDEILNAPVIEKILPFVLPVIAVSCFIFIIAFATWLLISEKNRKQRKWKRLRKKAIKAKKKRQKLEKNKKKETATQRYKRWCEIRKAKRI